MLKLQSSTCIDVCACSLSQYTHMCEYTYTHMYHMHILISHEQPPLTYFRDITKNTVILHEECESSELCMADSVQWLRFVFMYAHLNGADELSRIKTLAHSIPL